LKIEIIGQFVNFKIFEGSICNSLEIYWGQFEDQNANFEK
jgi:hypothetical protein